MPPADIYGGIMSLLMSEHLSTIHSASIFENMSDGVFIINASQEISYVNPAAERIFGMSDNDLLQKKVAATILNNRKNRSFNRLLQNALRSAKQSDTSVVTYYSSTGKKTLTIRISRQENDAGEESLLVMMEDITVNQNLKRHERDCAIIFAGLITCICVYLCVWCLLEFTLNIHLGTSVYTLMIEGIAFLLFLQILIFTSMTPGDIGIFVRPKRLFQTFRQVLPVGLAVCAIMLVANWLLRLNGIYIKPYFIGGSLHGAYTYIFTAILQEFLSRGVIQTCVKSLMRIKGQRFFTIMLTSLLFALMHLPFGFPFMMGALALSVALGIFYEKQENIWGCAFLHWSCGYIAMALFF